jgi:hypothetical protein
MLKTTTQVKTSDKIKEAINLGFSDSAIAKVLDISRPTYYKKLAGNDWTDSEILLLKSKRII